MNHPSHTWLRFAVLIMAGLPAFAGTSSVVPEPSMVALTAVGVGAIVVLARKKRGR